MTISQFARIMDRFTLQMNILALQSRITAFHTTSKKKRERDMFEAAIDQQFALERDVKHNYVLMSPQPKHKAFKSTPCKTHNPVSKMVGGVPCQAFS